VASRLSSLLVRDGLVGVKRMEKAFQRQVIYGGSLDTILLEMNVLSEERLTQYLALSSGLPPATREESNVFDPEAVARVTRELAAKHRIVPLIVHDDALRVLVCDPVDMALLEDLADVIDFALQPLIVPEYRWHVVFHRTYGDTPPARFSTLARQADAGPQTAPVGRARSVIVEDGDHIVVDVRTPGEAAAAIASGDMDDRTVRVAPLHDDSDVPQLPRTPTRHGFAPGPSRVAAIDSTPSPDLGRTPTPVPGLPSLARTLTPPAGIQRLPTPATGVPITGRTATPGAGVPTVPALGPTLSRPMPTPTPVRPSRSTLPGVVPAPTAPPPPRSTRAPTAPTVLVPDPNPITAQEARAILAVAEDRDTIFVTLLRAIRYRTRWAGLLTVQGGAAIGRLALAESGVDTASVTTVLIPLDVVTPFRTAVTLKRPYVGTVLSGDPGIDAMVLRMGGAIPPAAAVLPIVLRDRVVALAIGHRLVDDLVAADVAEILPLAGLAAEAVSRLIVRHKSAGYRTPDDASPLAVEDVATKRITRSQEEQWAAVDGPPPPEDSAVVASELASDESGPEVSISAEPAEPARPIGELLDAIETGDESALLDELIDETFDRLGETLPAIAERFPGVLRVGRYQVSGRRLRAAQYGGLLELVVRIGPPAAELLIARMAAADRDVRFYATVCVAELRPRNAVHALVERLFDADYGVRECAVEALAGYPLRDLDEALASARSAVRAGDIERVVAATTAIAELADVGAIPDLIAALDIDGKHADLARRTLVLLTKQDLGPSPRKWRKWWDDNRRRHRIEWLIDGLLGKEADLRQAAIDELRRLTGEYFGYHHDLGKKEREASVLRWNHWWLDSGRRRFSREAVPDPANERDRATGQTPAIRDT
jgi:hypothetical protein